MKHSYFGDIHDYHKYALLRQLSNHAGVGGVVCWMLTKSSSGPDGRRIGYLEDPHRWRSFEPKLYDFLRERVLEDNVRSVRHIERSALLPRFRFFSSVLTDDSRQRERYFDDLFDFARGSDIIFFDPDNGLEIKSVQYGRTKSSKYIFRSEVSRAYRAGHSLLIYQHLPYQPRIPYINGRAESLIEMLGAPKVHAIRNGQVAFFLVPQPRSDSSLRTAVSAVSRKWTGVLKVTTHVGPRQSRSART